MSMGERLLLGIDMDLSPLTRHVKRLSGLSHQRRIRWEAKRPPLLRLPWSAWRVRVPSLAMRCMANSAMSMISVPACPTSSSV